MLKLLGVESIKGPFGSLAGLWWRRLGNASGIIGPSAHIARFCFYRDHHVEVCGVDTVCTCSVSVGSQF